MDKSGTPFFWSGDAAWSIIAQLNKEDVVFYLDNRKQKGFSVILANLIENKYGSNAPANIYGDPPLETDTLHLMTAHNHAGTMATTYWENDLWLTVNNVYSYDSTIYRHYKTAYQLSPAMPYFMIESGYENEHKRNSTPVQLRSQAYQAVLSGAMGYIFGNCPIWHFGATSIYCGGLTDWKPELDNQGSRGIDYLQRLFRSRDWVRLAPDFEHRFIVDGYGEWGSTNYVTAAIAMDKSTLIAYLPISQPVTIDLSSMAGNSSKCWWYNPSTADAKLIGTFNNTGLKTFTPPDGDWVLVVDNVELHLPPPGKI